MPGLRAGEIHRRAERSVQQLPGWLLLIRCQLPILQCLPCRTPIGPGCINLLSSLSLRSCHYDHIGLFLQLLRCRQICIQQHVCGVPSRLLQHRQSHSVHRVSVGILLSQAGDLVHTVLARSVQRIGEVGFLLALQRGDLLVEQRLEPVRPVSRGTVQLLRADLVPARHTRHVHLGRPVGAELVPQRHLLERLRGLQRCGLQQMSDGQLLIERRPDLMHTLRDGKLLKRRGRHFICLLLELP